mgnify:FL=1
MIAAKILELPDDSEILAKIGDELERRSPVENYMTLKAVADAAGYHPTWLWKEWH